MEQVDRTVGVADRFQQRRTWLAFPFAVWKKFSDDQAGNLAALISYYAIAAIFPLMLVLATILEITLKNDPDLRKNLLNSAIAQYPVIGPQIEGQLGSMSGSGVALVFGMLILVYGARGVAAAMQNAMCELWGISRKERPGFPMSWVHQLVLVVAVGTGFLVTTFLSGVAGSAGHFLPGIGGHLGALAISFAANVGMFWFAFRLASLRRVPWSELKYGAIVAAVVWQVLQLAGSYIVQHQVNHASALYGTFGVVLGLMAWLYLQAEVTLYAAEIDVVLVRRLWPRSLKSDDGASPAGPKPSTGPGSGTAAGTDNAGTRAA
jgi:YihY family inner membrane protein